MQELNGKVAVVTGGASGIGLALVERFLDAGMSVVLADVDPAGLDAQVHRLTAAGGRVLGVPTDVSDAASVTDLAIASWAHFGAVHVLCNNAGVGPGGVTWELPDSVWRWVIDVDLWGVVHGIQAFVPRLVEQGEGHVLNTASVAGIVGTPGMAPYSAAKHAVVGLSQSLRRDLQMAGSPVGVSVLCPGMTRTRMNESGRNWPADRLGPPPATGLEPSHPATRQDFLHRSATQALEASDVAAQAVSAIQDDRFWVVTDPSVLDRLEAELAEARRSVEATVARPAPSAPERIAAED